MRDLASELAPYPLIRGPHPSATGTLASVQIGDVVVDLEIDADKALVATAGTRAAGLYVDLSADASSELVVRSNDPAYASLLIEPDRGRLGRALHRGGAGQLRLGVWRVRGGPAATARELAGITAALAGRPRSLGEAWAAAAAAIGATARPVWSTRGDGAFTIATRGPTVTVDLVMAGGDGDAPRLHTRLEAGRHRRDVPGAVLDPHALAAAVRALVGVDPVQLPAASAPSPPPAPLAFADWPAARTALASTSHGRWRPGPPLGPLPPPGAEAEVDLDGVPVRSRCAPDTGATTIAAPAAGTEGLTVAARPGYRFLRGLFLPEPRLGDRAFDDRYVLDVSDLAWARWWLGPDEREAITATFHPEAAQPLALALAERRVWFWAEAPPAPPFADAARYASAFLAQRDRRATAQWRHLAASLGATIDGVGFVAAGGMVARTGRGAVAIELTTAIRGGHLVTVTRAGPPPPPDAACRLWLRHDRSDDALAPHHPRAGAGVTGPDDYTARTTAPAWAAPRLAAIAPTVAAARPDLIELDDERVVVTMAGPVFDLARLTAGIELVARAARHGAIAAAPYR
ncbi:MAG: hypothetical protein R3B06_19365 [Kofleriaceae bacterium]